MQTIPGIGTFNLTVTATIGGPTLNLEFTNTSGGALDVTVNTVFAGATEYTQEILGDGASIPAHPTNEFQSTFRADWLIGVGTGAQTRLVSVHTSIDGEGNLGVYQGLAIARP
jgi:hypothetical protein